jgi:hypothetical protein
MSSFSGKLYALDTANNPSFSSSIGHTLQFGPATNMFWFKHYGQAIAQNSYDPSASSGSPATFLASYSGFPSTVGPATQLFPRKLLAALDFNGVSGASADTLELYDFSNPNNPLLIASNRFPANAVANANRIGQIIMTTNYVFAIDANNGLLAMRFSPPPPLALSNLAFTNNQFQFDVTGEQTRSAIVYGSSNLVNWVSLATNTIGPFHFLAPASPPSPLRFYRAAYVSP